MSEILQQKRKSGQSGTIRSYTSDVANIDFGGGAVPPTITLADGLTGQGACLGCRDTPCMLKVPDEAQVPAAFESFPGEPSLDVCPTQALKWDEKCSSIEVIASDCIGCGLCVVRCPYGAIYLEGGKAAKVLTGNVSGSIGITQTAATKREHPSPLRQGRLGSSVGAALANLDQVVPKLGDARSLLLMRNILHELGVQCRVRRRGDVNIRIDAVIAFENGEAGVIEMELDGSGAGIASGRFLKISRYFTGATVCQLAISGLSA